MIRVSAWAMAIALLAFLGYVLHAWLPPMPRWSIRGAIRPTAFSPDGKLLRTHSIPAPSVLGSLPDPVGPVQFWDAATGAVCLSVRAEANGVRDGFHFSESGVQLAAVIPAAEANTQQLCHIDLTTGLQREMRLPSDSFWNCDISAKGGLITLTSDQRTETVCVLDAESFREIAQFEQAVWQWSKDGQSLVALASGWKGARMLHHVTRSRHAAHAIDDGNAWLGLSPDGQSLLTCPATGRGELVINVWEVTTGQRRTQLRCEQHGQHHAKIESAANFSCDGRLVAALVPLPDEDARVAVWDLSTGLVLGSIRAASPAAFAFTPDGKSLAVATNKPAKVALYQVPSLEASSEASWSAGEIRQMHFTADGRLVVESAHAGEPEQQLHVFDCTQGVAKRLGRSSHAVPCVTWSRDHCRALYVSECDPAPSRFRVWLSEWLPQLKMPNGRTIKIWVYDLERQNEVFHLEGPDLHDVRLSPDGRSIAVCTHGPSAAGRTICCYDIPQRKPLLWVFGVPLGIALLGAILYAARQRRKTRGNRRLPGAHVGADGR